MRQGHILPPTVSESLVKGIANPNDSKALIFYRFREMSTTRYEKYGNAFNMHCERLREQRKFKVPALKVINWLCVFFYRIWLITC